MNSSMIQFLSAASRLDDYDDHPDSPVQDQSIPEKHSNSNPITKLKNQAIDESSSRPGFHRSSSIENLLPDKLLSSSNTNNNINIQPSSSIQQQSIFEDSNNNININNSQSKLLKSYHKLSISEKIQSIFDLTTAEELIKEYPCWLMSTVLLQGNLYITTNHLLYYAHVTQDRNDIIKSGFLHRKHNRAYSTPYWFVLRDHSLSYFLDSTDIYYPYGLIDLKSILSIQRASKGFGFKVFTVTKKLHLVTDSEVSLEEWVGALKKAVFRAKHGGNVKIKVPLESVVDVELTRTFRFAETLRIKSVESNFAMDDHYFVFFEHGDLALESCSNAVKLYQLANPNKSHAEVNEVMKSNTDPLPKILTTLNSDSKHGDEELIRSSTGLSGLLGPVSVFNFGRRRRRSSSLAGNNELDKDGSTNSRRSSFSDLEPDQLDMFNLHLTDHEDGTDDESGSTKPLASPNSHSRNTSSDFKLTNWLKIPGIKSKKEVEPSVVLSPPFSPPNDSFLESSDSSPSFSFSLPSLNAPSLDSFLPSQADIYTHFALPNTEATIESFGCLFLRVVPRWGRLLITTEHICFYCTVVGLALKVIVPLADIRKADNVAGLRLLHYGLAVHTLNGQELFFEFRSSKHRNRCTELLNQLTQHANEDPTPTVLVKNEPGVYMVDLGDRDGHRFIKEFDLNKKPTSLPIIADDPNQISELMKGDCMKKLHITCMTIGTRGDVQPYIALCKGLMKHGHTTRIATHDEYQEWIEGHGIEFKSVAGDPGELMKLCVDNGMFSISFLREGVSKFRGWIDELLISGWEACQGTDVLIESPTAMGGIHIAEKLDIPFYQCFPMPWTRTRAFPHPFAISDRNMGGSYNYMTYVLIEQVLWKGIAWQVNRFRKETLKLNSIGMDQMEPDRVPFLYSFSPSIVPPPVDWHDWIHPCGFFFLDEPNPGWEPSQELLQFLDHDVKPIYVGFGSITVPDPYATTNLIIEASQMANVRIILSEGWSSRMSGEQKDIQYPSNVLPIKSVPHDWLFSKVAAVMHHGGAGTTAAGLRAGKPAIIKPFFGDQYFWAQQIERLGIGVYLKKFNAAKLASAFEMVLDEKVKDKAELIGDQIRKENGVDTAIKYLFRDLKYARQRLNKQDGGKGEGYEANLTEDINNNSDESKGWWMVDPTKNDEAKGQNLNIHI